MAGFWTFARVVLRQGGVLLLVVWLVSFVVVLLVAGVFPALVIVGGAAVVAFPLSYLGWRRRHRA